MTEFVRGVDWLRSKVKGPGEAPERKRKWQVSIKVIRVNKEI